MSEVIYYRGVTIESEADVPRLTIEGRRLPVRAVGGTFECDEAGGVARSTLRELAEAIVDRSPETVTREAARQAHLAILADGVETWNTWRRHHPDIRPLLFDAELSSAATARNLQGINFAQAVLIGATLDHARLEDANFHEANLGGARLRHAQLQRANFCRTDLFRTDLSDANLTAANLQGTGLTLTRLERATIVGCTIYGISAWDLLLKDATQSGLTVLYQQNAGSAQYEEGRFVVNDLKSAQFVYSLLDNQNVREAIQALTSKIVVILGRFRDGGIEVLQKVAGALRQAGYLPIVFNFERPQGRNYRETVKALVALSRFVIADLSGSSVPAELEANVPDFPSLPFIPILEKGREGYSTFEDLPGFPWVLDPIVVFTDADHLVSLLPSDIIGKAEAWASAHERRTGRPVKPADAV